jgi:hypothetical protein
VEAATVARAKRGLIDGCPEVGAAAFKYGVDARVLTKEKRVVVSSAYVVGAMVAARESGVASVAGMKWQGSRESDGRDKREEERDGMHGG